MYFGNVYSDVKVVRNVEGISITILIVGETASSRECKVLTLNRLTLVGVNLWLEVVPLILDRASKSLRQQLEPHRQAECWAVFDRVVRVTDLDRARYQIDPALEPTGTQRRDHRGGPAESGSASPVDHRSNRAKAGTQTPGLNTNRSDDLLWWLLRKLC